MTTHHMLTSLSEISPLQKHLTLSDFTNTQQIVKGAVAETLGSASQAAFLSGGELGQINSILV